MPLSLLKLLLLLVFCSASVLARPMTMVQLPAVLIPTNLNSGAPAGSGLEAVAFIEEELEFGMNLD